MVMPHKHHKKRCVTCGKEFECQPSHDDRMHNCSIECRKAADTRKKYQKELGTMSKALKAAESTRLSPAQSAKIRGQIARMVKSQINWANEVVEGSREWSPTQARVFGTLLAKVVPDLSASYHQHEVTNKELVELSRDELERIAAGIEVTSTETIDVSQESSEERPKIIDHAPAVREGDG